MNFHPAIQVFLDAGRWDRAIELIGEQLKSDPEDAWLLSRLAMCYINSGQQARAYLLLQDALRLEPDDAFCHYLTGFAVRNGAIQLSQIQWESEAEFLKRLAIKARVHFKEALRLQPLEADFLAAMASNELDAWQPEEAVAYAEQGLALDAENKRCLMALANALDKRGERKRADEARLRVLSLDPLDPESHLGRGWSLLRYGLHRESLEHFRVALRESPDSSQARGGMQEALKRSFYAYRMVAGVLIWLNEMERDPRKFMFFIVMFCVAVFFLSFVFFGLLFLLKGDTHDGAWAGIAAILGLLMSGLFGVVGLLVPTLARWFRDLADYTLLMHRDGRMLLSKWGRFIMVAWAMFVGAVLVLMVFLIAEMNTVAMIFCGVLPLIWILPAGSIFGVSKLPLIFYLCTTSLAVGSVIWVACMFAFGMGEVFFAFAPLVLLAYASISVLYRHVNAALELE